MLRNNMGTRTPENALTTLLPEFADKVLRKYTATKGHILASRIDVNQVGFKSKVIWAT